jgi:hypothetical protein
MKHPPVRQSKERRRIAGTKRGWFHAQPLQLRPAPQALELPLRASPRLRHARWIPGGAVLLYMLELSVSGHWMAATAVAVLAAWSSWPWKPRNGARCATCRSLVVATDGELFLVADGRCLQQVWLRPESLRLGSHVLLVLTGHGRTIRLLFGPDNLAPAELAALKRRLPAGPAPPGTALHSPPASCRSDQP